MKRNWKIGTRGSALALWQANQVQQALRANWPDSEFSLERIQTTGDRIADKPLVEIGSKALFTKEIEEALLSEGIDFAAHSLKDLPTQLPSGLEIGAVLERGPEGDVLISKNKISLERIPPHSIIATGSLRRRAQLLHYRPDLKLENLRGNLPTRIRKLKENNWAAIILAEAGVVRLGLESEISERLPFSIMLPSVGQGAVAIEIRSDDETAKKMIEPMNHVDTWIAVTAERSFLRRLEGGCHVPIAARGWLESERLYLEGMVSDLEGRQVFRDCISSDPTEANALGIELAEKLLDAGAAEILDRLRMA